MSSPLSKKPNLLDSCKVIRYEILFETIGLNWHKPWSRRWPQKHSTGAKDACPPVLPFLRTLKIWYIASRYSYWRRLPAAPNSSWNRDLLPSSYSRHAFWDPDQRKGQEWHGDLEFRLQCTTDSFRESAWYRIHDCGANLDEMATKTVDFLRCIQIINTVLIWRNTDYRT